MLTDACVHCEAVFGRLMQIGRFITRRGAAPAPRVCRHGRHRVRAREEICTCVTRTHTRVQSHLPTWQIHPLAGGPESAACPWQTRPSWHSCQRRNKGECKLVMRVNLGLSPPKSFYQERREMLLGHGWEMAHPGLGSGDSGPAACPPCTRPHSALTLSAPGDFP